MKISHEYEHFRNELQPALKSKVEEFHMLGYGRISERELWNFLTHKKWRKPKLDIRMYELVQDILGLRIGEYMNYATIEAFKLSDFSFDNKEDRDALLK
ncbi:post-transcriptional regulator [Cytobacillus spongiae]|jgi:hypothetical protein|uniref:post-transcriptional regulator n=1 Tax=Cytobacillus spongiae TaxID=2901381 RepID=UPI001F26B12A|nr:post-transcriptional regulator [Cytobacillus spongiae]UII55007.1 post-transcriptional regulator [Cytobacillus spongiae]